jgi:hypothetical protein
MRSKRLAATAGAGLALLTSVAFAGTTSAQEVPLESTIVVELEVIGDGPTGPYDLVIGCLPVEGEGDGEGSEPAATVDIPFELSVDEIVTFTDVDLGVDFSEGADCTIAVETMPDQLGAAIAVVDDEGNTVAGEEFADVDVAVLSFSTELGYDGPYGVGVINVFAETPASTTTTSTTAAPSSTTSTTRAPAAQATVATPRFTG